MFKSFKIFKRLMSKIFLTSKMFVQHLINFDAENKLWIKRKSKRSCSKKHVRIWITRLTKFESIINFFLKFRSKKHFICIRDRWSKRHDWSWSKNFFYTTVFWRMNLMSKRFSQFCSSSKTWCNWKNNFCVSSQSSILTIH